MDLNKNKNFGTFLSNLLQKKDSAMSSSAVESLKKKLEEEKAARIEQRLRGVANDIERHVHELRRVRKQEQQIKELISNLETKAQAIVEGTDEDI